MENAVTVCRTGLAVGALVALLVLAPSAPLKAQFAGEGGSTGITLEIAGWVPAPDKSYGGWGVVAAGGPFDKPLQFTNDAPTLNLPAGLYDVYWVQDYGARDRPILVAAGVKVESGLVAVKVDTGIRLEVAAFVPPRDKDYGSWAAVAAGGEPDKPANATNIADALVLAPGDYDIYWVQDYGARDRPLRLATAVKVEAGKLASLKADSGVKIAVASWVPARDKDYGWWEAVPRGGKPDEPANRTNVADALLLPPGIYDVYWAQDYGTRDAPMLLAANLALHAGKVETVVADSGVKLEVAPFIPPLDKDYGWWGAVKAGDKPEKLVNWSKSAAALLLPPGDYDVYWAQDYNTRDKPILLAGNLAVAAGKTVTVAANSGIELEVAAWVPPRHEDYGWWGAVPAGADPDKLVNWTNKADALLLPPAFYDVYWAQDYATRDKPILVESNVRVSGPFSGVGLQLTAAGDAISVVNVIKDSPAERAGLFVGDTVVSVDGVSVKGLTLTEAVERMRGAAAAAVKIGVERAGSAGLTEVSVERAVIAALSNVRVATGMRPVVAADVPPLAEDGWWGVAPAWEGPDKLANWSTGKPDPLVLRSGRYDVWWKPDGSSHPLLKVRNVVVRFGELVDVPVGMGNLVLKPSFVTAFDLTADEGTALAAGGFPAGVKQVVARYEWKKAAIGYRIGVAWHKDGAKILEQGEPVAAAEGETRWILKTADGGPLPAGNYSIELIEDGELRWVADFVVAEKRADLGPAPPPAETVPSAETQPSTAGTPAVEASPAETEVAVTPPANATAAPGGEAGAGGTGGEWILVQAVTAAGDPTLSDDFSDPKSGWNTTDSGPRQVGYAEGAYRIAIDGTGQGWVAGTNDRPFADGILTVDARDSPGSTGHPFGVFVRGQDERSFHGFVIGADESYAAFHVDKGAFGMDGAPDQRLPPGVYRRDGANRIAVFLAGDRIVYFLNDREIDRATARWPKGAAGVVSANVRPGKTEVTFDDWKLWEATGGTAGAN